MEKSKKTFNLRALVGLGLPFLLVLFVSYLFQTSFISHKEFLVPWLQSFGPLLIVVYVILQSAAVIIAPIGGLIFLLAIVGIFGPEIGFTLSYLVTTPCYCINFLLARKYGRNFVTRILGEHVMKKFDHYVGDAGIGTITMLRIFMSGSFDYLSYALGLTNLSFRTFTIISFVAGFPATIFAYYVFTRFENFTSAVLAFQIFGIVSAGIAIGISHLQERNKR